MSTISDLIYAEINLINQTKEKWDAGYLSERLLSLSILYSNLTLHIAEMESAYYGVLRLALDKEDKISVSKAEIYARSGEEYAQLRKAQNLEKAVIETIRSLKKYIRVKEQEREASVNL
jgi:hypothetical protein